MVASSKESAAEEVVGEVEAEPEPPGLKCLRSLVFATNVLNNLSLGCTAPFLQHHLEVSRWVSGWVSGRGCAHGPRDD